MDIGCIVLAAGNAARFGSNKLLRTVAGKSLIHRTLESIPTEQFSQVVVVTQYPEIAAIAKEFSFTSIHNDHPDWGQSYSIRLGITALQPCDAVLFMVADQPLLRRESVAQLLTLAYSHPDNIACLSCNGVKGNPCLFPARFFGELLALEGDCGGRAIRKNHENDTVTLEVPQEELWDVDTPEALAELDN